MLSSVLSIVVFMQQDAKEIYKNLTPSMVAIKTDVASGSGFVLKSNGLICTAAHVIENAKTVTVRFSDGKEYESTGLIDVDEKNDVAVFRARFLDRPEVKMQTKAQEIGSKLFIVSAPLGLEFSISEGILSQYRTFESAQMLQHTCQTSPGSSGGAVCNQTGEVVGVHNSKRVGGEGLNFAVAAEHVAALDLTLPTTKYDACKWNNKSTRIDNGTDQTLRLKSMIWKLLSELYYLRDLRWDINCEVSTKSANLVFLSSEMRNIPVNLSRIGSEFQNLSINQNAVLSQDLQMLASNAFSLSNGFNELIEAVYDARRRGWVRPVAEAYDASWKKIDSFDCPLTLKTMLLNNYEGTFGKPFDFLFVDKEIAKRNLWSELTGSQFQISKLPLLKISRVSKDSLFAKVGIEKMDTVLAIDGKEPLENLVEFLDKLKSKNVVITVKLKKLNGSLKEVTIRT
jgi:S1-C subfamily serine protease